MGQKVYFKLNWQHVECTPLENILLSLQLLSSTNKSYTSAVNKSFDQIVYEIHYYVHVVRRVIFMIIIKKKNKKTFIARILQCRYLVLRGW